MSERKFVEACIWSESIPCDLVEKALENPEMYVDLDTGELYDSVDNLALLYEPEYGLQFCYADEYGDTMCENIDEVIEKCKG